MTYSKVLVRLRVVCCHRVGFCISRQCLDFSIKYWSSALKLTRPCCLTPDYKMLNSIEKDCCRNSLVYHKLAWLNSRLADLYITEPLISSYLFMISLRKTVHELSYSVNLMFEDWSIIYNFYTKWRLISWKMKKNQSNFRWNENLNRKPDEHPMYKWFLLSCLGCDDCEM